MFCEVCRQQMNTEARFCCHCGKPMEVQQGWNSGSGRLTRPREDRMIAGVCAGIAQQYGWDPVLVRLLTVVIFFLGCGTIFIAYIAAWIIMPNAPLFYVAPPPANYAGTAGSAPIS
jgi:phage shock protein C